MLFIPFRFTGTDGPSGFGFELTFRLKRETGESAPPTWPAELMQGLARYVFQSGKSPNSWGGGPFAMSLVGSGNLQVYFDVSGVTFLEGLCSIYTMRLASFAWYSLGGKLPRPWERRMCHYGLQQKMGVSATVLTP